MLIAKSLLVKHHSLEHELSHQFLIILAVSMAPLERLKKIPLDLDNSFAFVSSPTAFSSPDQITFWVFTANALKF